MSNQRLADDARQLPEVLREAARWSIPIDKELLGRLEDANGILEGIKAATADAERQLSALKADIDSSLGKSVSIASSGALLDEGLIDVLAASMLRLDAVETILESYRVGMDRAEQTRVEAAATLANATQAATTHLQRELKERYQNFRVGRGERPVMSKPTGAVRIRCQDCMRVIGLVDTEMLSQSLSATIFNRLDGEGNLFGSQSTPNHWKCPACGYGPFKDDRWILTEFWTFIQVPDAIQGQEKVDVGLVVPETDRMTAAESDHQETGPVEPTVPADQLARKLRDDTILQLHEQGQSERKIAAIIGCGKSTVHDILVRQPDTGASL